MSNSTAYYNQILEVLKDYLGPAAPRFLDRQISLHLQKNPLELSKNDIEALAIRVRSGLVVVAKNSAIADEAFQRLRSINGNQG